MWEEDSDNGNNVITFKKSSVDARNLFSFTSVTW